MKVTINPDALTKIPVQEQFGVISHIVFDDVIKALIDSEKIYLRSNESIVGIEITSTGLNVKYKYK